MIQDEHPDALRASKSEALRGSIEVPGDKSISHRALILGALAEGETQIAGLLESADVLDTARALQMFGADVQRLDEGSWRVSGVPWRSPDGPIDCGNSGTGARLLMGAAAGIPIEATFTGDASLRSRPMKRVIDPLRLMGAKIEERDMLPVRLIGGELKGISFRSPHPSAQVKSAVLLAGLHATGPVKVFEAIPTRDHTEQMLRQFGCDVEIANMASGRQIMLGPNRRLQGNQVAVPGDPSSAAFPLVAAIIVPGSEVTVKGVLDSHLRSGLFDVLAIMGARIEYSNRRWVGSLTVVDIKVSASKLVAADVPAAKAASMIDEYPLLAVATAYATGRSVMRGLAELRMKESDRLAAIIDGLSACGVKAWAENDDLIVEGSGDAPQGGAQVKSCGDHRIAMSFLTLGLGAAQPVDVDHAGMIGTSFPGFADLMRSIGANIARPANDRDSRDYGAIVVGATE